MIYVVVAISLALIDLLIKKCIQKKIKEDTSKNICNDKVSIKYVKNHGAVMGALQKRKKLLDFSSTLALGALITLFIQTLLKKGMQIRKIGFTMMVAGAVSNVYERVFKGYVVDYIHLNNCKVLKKIVFNIADVFLFIGGIIALIYEIFCGEK